MHSDNQDDNWASSGDMSEVRKGNTCNSNNFDEFELFQEKKCQIKNGGRIQDEHKNDGKSKDDNSEETMKICSIERHDP
jgi:hypothetical protein